MAMTDFGAKSITLTAMSNDELYHGNPRRIAMGLTDIPKVSPQRHFPISNFPC